jgi:hypothetical protein
MEPILLNAAGRRVARTSCPRIRSDRSSAARYAEQKSSTRATKANVEFACYRQRVAPEVVALERRSGKVPARDAPVRPGVPRSVRDSARRDSRDAPFVRHADELAAALLDLTGPRFSVHHG